MADTIGSIKWAIHDTATSQHICEGEKTLQMCDVEISPMRDDQSLLLKQIKLGTHFVFGIVDSANSRKAEDSDDGFGLVGARDDVDTYSWDWFNVDRAGHATKLKELGELSFDTKKTPNGIEITRMAFLTDVSVRVSRITDEDEITLAWRIKIFMGSVISWPSLNAAGDV